MFIWTEEFPCPKELSGYHADSALKKIGVPRFRDKKIIKPKITWRPRKV